MRLEMLGLSHAAAGLSGGVSGFCTNAGAANACAARTRTGRNRMIGGKRVRSAARCPRYVNAGHPISFARLTHCRSAAGGAHRYFELARLVRAARRRSNHEARVLVSARVPNGYVGRFSPTKPTGSFEHHCDDAVSNSIAVQLEEWVDQVLVRFDTFWMPYQFRTCPERSDNTYASPFRQKATVPLWPSSVIPLTSGLSNR